MKEKRLSTSEKAFSMLKTIRPRGSQKSAENLERKLKKGL